MEYPTILIDFVGSTAHYTSQLEATLNKKSRLKTILITIKQNKKITSSFRSKLFNTCIRLTSLVTNYLLLFIKIISSSSGQVFIFNIPLAPFLEIFFLWLIGLKGGISIGILHNHLPSHGEKKLIRNYRYSNFYDHCDVVIYHDSSISPTFSSAFPNSKPLFINLPSYSIPNASEFILRKKPNSDIIKLCFMGTIRPYKNLEIILSEFALLNKQQLSSLSLKISGKAFYDIDNIIKGLNGLEFADFSYNKNPTSDDQFYREMAACNFVLLPHETTSGSALLSVAASLGVPIIASNHSVFTDFVQSYENGIIFDHLITGDLHRVISSLIDDKSLQKRLKDNAVAALATIPTWSNYVDEIFISCEDLIEAKL